MNEEIRAKEVRVVEDGGGMLGIMPVSEALRLAADKGLDLIEVAPDASPPTCKIMDYGKHKYEQKKKAQESKKKQTVIDVKEIQLRPRTDQHDLDVKLKHARRFLEGGDKAKFTMRFRGREMAHQEVGKELLEKAISTLTDIGVVEVSPKMDGRQLFALVAPSPALLKELQKKKKNEVSKKHDESEAESEA
ncbi:MAG: translation initiation factor IF-3 [Bdellovibrionales bacterium]|nr:translation initiation factor IF-3 [Bdellovibrionales bacterium]